uniref:LXG domain-containing protein n=1 Tax=Steinernema glaseri TaxID=37863 RepID=A0A1I7Y4N0_9BILA
MTVFEDTVRHDIEFTESDIRLGYNDDILKAEQRMQQYLKSIQVFQTSHGKELEEFHGEKKLDQLRSEVENTLAEIREYHEGRNDSSDVFLFLKSM